MKPIAVIHTDFKEKFGIPRQSGLVDELIGEIVFETPYRCEEALRGLECFSHIWLIWEFSKAKREDWLPTVRPPRLGGNRRLGVFATRSPFRPNPIGLSCVRLLDIKKTADKGTVLIVAGADLMDGTPIFDIKPYLPYADAHPEATGGFTDETVFKETDVSADPELLKKLPSDKRNALLAVLRQNPRPSYQHDSERIYGMRFSDYDVRFRYTKNGLTIIDILSM